MNHKKIAYMMIILIVIGAIFLIRFLSISNDSAKCVVWNQIVNREWSNIDAFPGTGFYFFQEDGGKYCLFMVYGSGLPIIYRSISEVTIRGNQIEIAVPDAMDLKETVPGVEKQSSDTFIIQFENDHLIFSNMEYTNMRLNNEDTIWDEIERFKKESDTQSKERAED